MSKMCLIIMMMNEETKFLTRRKLKRQSWFADYFGIFLLIQRGEGGEGGTGWGEREGRVGALGGGDGCRRGLKEGEMGLKGVGKEVGSCSGLRVEGVHVL